MNQTLFNVKDFSIENYNLEELKNEISRNSELIEEKLKELDRILIKFQSVSK